ncbi:MAG: peptidoglycan-binding protein [Oscillatoria sp. PMC 1051.18]|nr:peptidoglycan-binding protein [Oscillatoria sp. PMC 1050.18]MEC5028908.1 peptidoglycan-binding protein [Oscillatoria sp. PMC 1051.18]
MELTLKVIRDTVFKQQPIDSTQIEDPNDKYEIDAGAELVLHSWANLAEEEGHLRVAFLENTFNGRNTWYAYIGHVEIWQDDTKIFPDPPPPPPPPVSILVKDVKACTTSVVKKLDRQIIEEMNQIIPNALVNFEDLNVLNGPAVWALLQPPAKAALQRAIQDRGLPMTINSAYRTIAQQLILYNHYRNRRCGIPVAAYPSRSNHQSGLAIDIQDYWSWRPYLERRGWRWLGPHDPVHFDYVGGGTRDIRSLAVLAFQRVWNKYNINNRIAEDGDYGPITNSKLNYSPIEGFGTSIRPDDGGDIPYRILRLSDPFMQGPDVSIVQKALVDAGFNLIVDGLYGPGTQTAVKQFQSRKGLEVDGIVGPATRVQLGLSGNKQVGQSSFVSVDLISQTQEISPIQEQNFES